MEHSPQSHFNIRWTLSDSRYCQWLLSEKEIVVVFVLTFYVIVFWWKKKQNSVSFRRGKPSFSTVSLFSGNLIYLICIVSTPGPVNGVKFRRVDCSRIKIGWCIIQLDDEQIARLIEWLKGSVSCHTLRSSDYIMSAHFVRHLSVNHRV